MVEYIILLYVIIYNISYLTDISKLLVNTNI